MRPNPIRSFGLCRQNIVLYCFTMHFENSLFHALPILFFLNYKLLNYSPCPSILEASLLRTGSHAILLPIMVTLPFIVSLSFCSVLHYTLFYVTYPTCHVLQCYYLRTVFSMGRNYVLYPLICCRGSICGIWVESWNLIFIGNVVFKDRKIILFIVSHSVSVV